MNGVADMVTTNNILVAGTEELLLSVQARGVRAGMKVLILGHVNVANEATVATHRISLLVRQGTLVTSVQIGETAFFDSVTGAGLLVESNIAFIDNAPIDDPTYGLFAVALHADTVTQSEFAVIPIG